jgi:hypothetical protein
MSGDKGPDKDWLPAELAEQLRRQQERLSEFRGRL